MPYLFLIQWNKGWKRKSLTQRVIVKWKKTHYVFEEKWWHMSFLFFDWPWEKKSSNSISPKKESLKFALHPREQYRGILLQLSGIYMPAVKPDYSPQVDTGLPGGASGKEAACQSRRHKRCRFIPLSREGLLEEVMTTHSSILAWRGPWTEEPHGLYSTG